MKKKHNNALDELQEYKNYLKTTVLGLKNLDNASDFMRKWNEHTIQEREREIVIIDKIIKNLIRF